MNNNTPKISFGIIVLNGEPFIKYNLRALYPFAHEIIIVEGAVVQAKANSDQNGHSIDGTLETVRKFQLESDPEKKLKLITKDGLWSEKDEMSQAYASQATGNYLWQIDSDEFYLPDDMTRIIEMLCNNPEITGMSFETVTFWGGIDVVTDGWFLRRGAKYYRRLFKWGTNYTYKTHRPPTVLDEAGRDLTNLNWTDAQKLANLGIRMYHYSLVFPFQVHSKSFYYDQAEWIKAQGFQTWANENYDELRNPFRVHNWYESPSWLERFHGKRPPAIEEMWKDVQRDKRFVLRKTDDVESLLNSPIYIIKRFFIKYLDYLYRDSSSRRAVLLLRNRFRNFVKALRFKKV